MEDEPGQAAGDTTPAARRRITRLNYLAVVLSGLASGWLGPFLPQIAAALGIGLERAGLMVSAAFAGFLLAMLLAGRVVERRGGRSALALAATLLAMGLLGVAASPRLAGVLAAAVLVGLGAGMLDVAGHVTIAALNPRRVTAALNTLNAFYGVGAFLGPLVVGLLLRGHIPYRAAYAAAGLAALAAAVALRTAPYSGARTPPPARAPAGAILARPAFWCLGLTLVCYIGLEAGIGAWLFTFLRIVGGVADAPASWSVSLFWIGLIAGRALGARWSAPAALRPGTLGSAALAAVSLLLLACGPAWVPLQLAAIVATGLGCGPLFANTIATGIALFPRRVGAMTSGIIAVGSLGGIVGPWLIGRALVAAGPRAAMLAACGGACLLAACYWLVGESGGAGPD